MMNQSEGSVSRTAGIVEGIRLLTERCTLAEEIGRRLALTPREVSGLLMVRPGERVSCNELSERMRLSPSRGSRIIAGLIADGYLARAEDGRDRRCVLLSLSPRGEECRQGILREQEACAKRLLSRLSEEQLRQVAEGVGILLEIL